MITDKKIEQVVRIATKTIYLFDIK